MRLFTLTSGLHGELSDDLHKEDFIRDIESALGESFDASVLDASSFDSPLPCLVYVRTGGTEGLFLQAYRGHEGKPVRLLTSGQSNSLAASMEILSWLADRNIPAEIIHGGPEQVALQFRQGVPSSGDSPYCKPLSAQGALAGKRYAVIGHPSDWLISSDVDYSEARRLLGAELIDVPIQELVELVRAGAGAAHPQLKPLNAPKYGRSLGEEDMRGALAIYSALKSIIATYSLDGLTLRCFDLLTALGNTGCMALALLNSEGYIATCEGDVPAMLSMALVRQKYGVSGFQANLSRIDGRSYLFAHCTVPLDMVDDYCYDTHFESGIGVAVHGLLREGPARIFKVSADLRSCFDEPVTLAGNPYGANLCRTQVLVQAPEALRDYFLRRPLGNHHIIIPL